MKGIQMAVYALLLLFSGMLIADTPTLLPGIHIQDGGGDLTVSHSAAPTVCDWNNDGAKDLVVGQLVYGNIWLFLNRGTDLNPHFNGGSLIESDGAPITTTYG